MRNLCAECLLECGIAANAYVQVENRTGSTIVVEKDKYSLEHGEWRSLSAEMAAQIREAEKFFEMYRGTNVVWTINQCQFDPYTTVMYRGTEMCLDHVMITRHTDSIHTSPYSRRGY